MPLQFKKALVTGASRGIGAAIAQGLAKEGVCVWKVLRKAPLLGDESCVIADLLVEEDLKSVEAWIEREKPDLLINAAGSGDCLGSLERSVEAWETEWKLNYEAPRRLNLAMARACSEKGVLVNVSSMVVDYPQPYLASYNATKAALSALSESLSDEFPRLRFIDLRPGDIRTQFADKWSLLSQENPAYATQAHLKACLKRAPKPEVVADTLIKALRQKRQGVVYAGSFFESVLGRIAKKVLPSGILRAARRGLFLRK